MAKLFDPKKPMVDYTFSCGRAFLMVGGCAIVMEGDKLRDDDLAEIGKKLMLEKWGHEPSIVQSYGDLRRGITVWTEELIKYVAAQANGGKLPE